MKSLKLKNYPGDNVTDFCDSILVDDERVESVRDFKPEHLGYTTCIFEDTSDSRFLIWDIRNDKEVIGFIKKLCVCDMYSMAPAELIYYEPPVKEAKREYINLNY